MFKNKANITGELEQLEAMAFGGASLSADLTGEFGARKGALYNTTALSIETGFDFDID